MHWEDLRGAKNGEEQLLPIDNPRIRLAAREDIDEVLDHCLIFT